MTNKMNVKLLRKIKAHILEEPKRLDMGVFVDTKISHMSPEERPECGTVACIAGWAVLLDRVDKGKELPRRVTNTFYWRVEKTAAKLLDLTSSEALQLFHVYRWPNEFGEAYENARTPRQRARVTAKRIEHFVKTKGAE